jgi:orotidine-5'-phosphate decarboxylase
MKNKEKKDIATAHPISDNERLLKKVVEILADYKFNSTQTETAEMKATKIINLIYNQALKDFVEECNKKALHKNYTGYYVGINIIEKIAKELGAKNNANNK